jgi:hypothetical protein
MARFTVTHNQAIWETMTFEVDVPDPLAEGSESPVEYIQEHLDELIADAIAADAATIEQGDRVESIDSDIEIRDEAGNKVYADVDEKEDY